MMRMGCSGPGGLQRDGGQEFGVILKSKKVKLRACIHPRIMGARKSIVP